MTTVSHGKPYAGNPHVRFEEGASESAKPSRKALLHTQCGGIYDTVWLEGWGSGRFEEGQ